MDAVAVLLVAGATALATALGALPLLLSRAPPRSWLGIANGLAAGFMVGAGIGLVGEGWGRSAPRTLLGVVAGVVAIAVTRNALERADDFRVGAFSGADARRMLLVVGLMTVHSFTEGVAVGVSFGGGDALGVVIALAIAIHNVPEGLAISLVLVPRGVSVRAAAGWSIFSSLPQPLMAVPAFLFVEAFEPLLPVGLGFAAGAMLWMVAIELLPEAFRVAPARTVVTAGIASAAAMVALQAALL